MEWLHHSCCQKTFHWKQIVVPTHYAASNSGCLRAGATAIYIKKLTIYPRHTVYKTEAQPRVVLTHTPLAIERDIFTVYTIHTTVYRL